MYPVYQPERRLSAVGLWATAGVLLADHILFWTWAPMAGALDDVEGWSGGWLQPTLTGNAVRFAALAALWFGVLRWRPRDLGLRAAGWVPALGVLAAGWLAIQAVRAGVALVAGDGLAWSVDLGGGSARWLLASVIAQVLGTAFVEEVVHRGLFIPQVYARAPGATEHHRLVWAVVLAATFFAVNHVPMLADLGYSVPVVAGAVVVIGAGGCFLAAVYLRTGNLYVAMAVHALANVPGDVVASPLDGRMLAYALGLACILWWPRPEPATGHVSRAIA